MSRSRTRVLLVQPRFSDDSFWNYQATARLVGARYPAIPLSLMTVGAMLPNHWDLRLVDENVENLRDKHLRWADLVMTTAMLPQRLSALKVIERAQAASVPVIVGGPDTTSSPAVYAHAEFQMLGEAEGILQQFFDDWDNGIRKNIYDAPKFKADVTASPIPRYDLVRRRRYLSMSLQFSRGCPFLCEFCDIIELYGRVPRTKTIPQVIAELDAIYASGWRGIVDFVDDNLIGNKKAVKALLPHIIEWQKAHRWPFYLTTEASLNLADDAELLGLMRDARFMAIFVGIESPDPDVLVKTQKKQNTRRNIANSIHKIYGAGIAVTGGFIIGMDEEKPGIADDLSALIEEAAISIPTISLLTALPGTQLERRLQAEGRFTTQDFTVIDPEMLHGDQCTLGLNFETQRPRGDVLRDYRDVVARAYDQDAFFARMRKMVRLLNMSGPAGMTPQNGFFGEMGRLIRLLWTVALFRPGFRGDFFRLLRFTWQTNLGAMNPAISLSLLYLHLGPFSKRVISMMDQRIADEAEASTEDLQALSNHWQRPVGQSIAAGE